MGAARRIREDERTPSLIQSQLQDQVKMCRQVAFPGMTIYNASPHSQKSVFEPIEPEAVKNALQAAPRYIYPEQITQALSSLEGTSR